MAYEILETCMLVPGISEKDCSGWVQAWGSILGLAIAIGLPLRLRRQDSVQRRNSELARAHVIGASISMTSGPLLGALNNLVRRMEEHQPGSGFLEVARTHEMLSLPVIPSESQVLAIAPVDRDAALAFARGSVHFATLRTAVGLLQNKNGTESVNKQLVALLPVAKSAKEEFEFAFARLEALVGR